MKGKSVVYASGGKNNWETPKFLFNYFNGKYNFNLDPAASHENHLCERYFTEEQDALNQDWGMGFRAFINCPYSGNKIQEKYFKHTFFQLLTHSDSLAMFLIPARTETNLWQDFIWPYSSLIWFPDERIHFSYFPTGAGFPSAFILFSHEGIKKVPDRFMAESGVRANIWSLELKSLPGYALYKDKIKENRLKLDLDANNQGTTGVCSDLARVDYLVDWERRD